MSAEAPLHPSNALTAALFIHPAHNGLESLVTHDTGCKVVMIQQKSPLFLQDAYSLGLRHDLELENIL